MEALVDGESGRFEDAVSDVGSGFMLPPRQVLHEVAKVKLQAIYRADAVLSVFVVLFKDTEPSAIASSSSARVRSK